MSSHPERFHGAGDLHFVTFSCYHRQPFLGSATRRDLFLKIFEEVRQRYEFVVVGYVVMPEHIHLLISEPNVGNPSTVMQVLKQRVSRTMHRSRRRTRSEQKCLWEEAPVRKYQPFWQRRFYDFNVWSAKKRNEKINYMHFNPVKRGLVKHPKDWVWSSYGFYSRTGTSLCVPNLEWEARTKA